MTRPREPMRWGTAGRPGPARLGFGTSRGLGLAEVPTGSPCWLASKPDRTPSLKPTVWTRPRTSGTRPWP